MHSTPNDDIGIIKRFTNTGEFVGVIVNVTPTRQVFVIYFHSDLLTNCLSYFFNFPYDCCFENMSAMVHNGLYFI